MELPSWAKLQAFKRLPTECPLRDRQDSFSTEFSFTTESSESKLSSQMHAYVDQLITQHLQKLQSRPVDLGYLTTFSLSEKCSLLGQLQLSLSSIPIEEYLHSGKDRLVCTRAGRWSLQYTLPFASDKEMLF